MSILMYTSTAIITLLLLYIFESTCITITSQLHGFSSYLPHNNFRLASSSGSVTVIPITTTLANFQPESSSQRHDLSITRSISTNHSPRRKENSITDYTFEDVDEPSSLIAPNRILADQMNDPRENEVEMYTNNHQQQSQTQSLTVANENSSHNSRHYSMYQMSTNSNSHSHGQPILSPPAPSHNKFVPHYGSNLNLNHIHSIFSKSPPTSSSISSLLAGTQKHSSSDTSPQSSINHHNYHNIYHKMIPSQHNHQHELAGPTSYSPYYSATAAASMIANANQQQVRPQPFAASINSNLVQDQLSLTNGGSMTSSSGSGATMDDKSLTLADLPGAPMCGRQQVVGYREPRIVGGNSTYEGEFPWAVSVQRHGNHHCGGVIVGRRWVLTAAHCVRSQLVGNLVVRTGGHTLSRSSNSINSHLERDYPVEQIVMHDDFSRYDNMTASQVKSSASTNNADIALLRLKHDIQWNEFAWPVCFPSQESGNFSGHDAVVIGWGKLNEKSEDFSNELQKVKLTIIDNKLCQNWFRQAGREMQIDDRIICAGFKNGGKDACHGDSGGPLLSRINGQFVVVGVVSTGIGCARPLLPGLYSRVSSYINWIERYIIN